MSYQCDVRSKHDGTKAAESSPVIESLDEALVAVAFAGLLRDMQGLTDEHVFVLNVLDESGAVIDSVDIDKPADLEFAHVILSGYEL